MSDPALLAPPGPHLPEVSHGEDVWLVDEAGRRYLDGSSGAVVTSLGHGNPEIASVLQKQAMLVDFAPLSAVLCTSKVAAALGSDELGAAAAHTYTNTPLPAAVGLAALEVMKRQDLVARASALGVVLHEALVSLSQEIEIIGDIRGLGLLQGVELVADRQTLEPFDPKLRVTARLVDAARHRGLLVYPAALGINGQAGDAIVVAPPLIISETDIGELVTRLREALLDVSGDLNEARPPHGFHRGGGTTRG
jgi:adenosylmethionine-8-amino-7-oxononanoate aminotransferase